MCVRLPVAHILSIYGKTISDARLSGPRCLSRYLTLEHELAHSLSEFTPAVAIGSHTGLSLIYPSTYLNLLELRSEPECHLEIEKLLSLLLPILATLLLFQSLS